MSLPFRYLTPHHYVEKTLEKLKDNDLDSKGDLTVGKFYLTGPDRLESRYIVTLFECAAALDTSTLKQITLCNVVMNDEAVNSLKILLQSRDEWKQVSFNQCSGPGLATLNTICVETIRILQCRMVDFYSLGEMLQTNAGLLELEIFEQDLTDANVASRFMIPGLSETATLKKLLLSYCQFNQESINLLSQALSHNQSLSSLFLPGCELPDESISTLIQSLQNHPKLAHVNLSKNYCSSLGSVALAGLSRIKTLNLSHQYLERAEKLDISPIASSLSTLTLTRLVLSFNKLNDADAEIMCNYLLTTPTTPLKELDLRANKIGDSGAKIIANLLFSKQTRLEKLYLFGNPIGEKGAASLCRAISRNTRLHTLNLGYSTCYYDDIQFYACLNRTGRQLLTSSKVVPAGLWPLVLQRTHQIGQTSRGVCTSADLMYCFLRSGPVLLEVATS